MRQICQRHRDSITSLPAKTMKTKEIYLLAAASMLVVAGLAAWRFTAIDKVAKPPTNASLPAPQATSPSPKTTSVTPKTTSSTPMATPATSALTTGRPTVSDTTEKVEILKKRISEEKNQMQATLAVLNAGPRASINASRARNKPEDMAFLKLLGLSDELRDKVYEMLTARLDLYWIHEEKIREAAQKQESYALYLSEIRQKEADIKAAVGADNYDKLKYYEATGLERLETGRFKDYLQSRSLPLTEQQEAAVVDAMYQLRKGKVGFSLNSRSISMEHKLTYIDKLKQSLAPVLNANDLALLEQHLKEVAGKTMKMLPLF